METKGGQCRTIKEDNARPCRNKEGERALAGGPLEGAMYFGLRTGDPGGNTVDGAGDCGRSASRVRITERNWESSQATDFCFFS